MPDTPVGKSTNPKSQSVTRTLTVKIRTLTPLWTGGVDGTMDRIHETGILGSLRWWYEAIVRGLGGYACDPTGDHRCPDKDGNYCDVCKVFGATGWRRRFRLEVVEDNTQPIWEPKDKMLNIRPPGRTRGWYLPPGRMGTLALKFTGDPKILSLMAALLLFLEKWGNLGAKPQLGCGVFAIENRDEVLKWAQGNGKEKPGWEWRILGNEAPNKERPDLRRFGFFKFRFPQDREGWWLRIPALSRVSADVQPLVKEFQAVPVAPVLKNEWRFKKWKGPRYLEQEIFGALRPKRERSKVVVSWAYLIPDFWEIRGWVWLASPRWAETVWRLIKDESTWQRLLVQGYPHTFWDDRRPQHQKDVLDMLTEVLQ